MDNIKISIITVCYNAEQLIESTILSVINQTYNNIEYIIIDGKSTDDTLKIIQKYSNYISIIISEPDNGIFDAMNKGLSLASGEFVNFMNAGDVFYSNTVIEQLFNKYHEDKFVGFIFGKTADIDGKVVNMLPFTRNPKKFKGMGICHQAIFVRRTIGLKYMFDQKYKVSADYCMMYNIYKDGYKALEYDDIICCYEGGGFSSLRPWQLTFETADITNSLNTFIYKYNWFIFIVKYYTQRIFRKLHVELYKTDYTDLKEML